MRVAGRIELSVNERLTLENLTAISEMLREAFSMSRAFAGSLVERHYTGLHAPAESHGN